MKIEINKIDGKWLINGKQYADLSDEEKQFFDEFIIAMKWQFEYEQKQNINPATSHNPNKYGKF